MFTIKVSRTNYDRFEAEDGEVYTAAQLHELRTWGHAIRVTDKTPADQGTWVLDVL